MRLCKRCGQEKDDSLFSKQTNNKTGFQLYCKPCYRENLRKWRAAHPEASARHYSQMKLNNPASLKRSNDKNSRRPNTRFLQAKNGAKKRGFEFNITFEDYSKLITQPCAYCGGELPPKGGSLDRVDPYDGYNLQNLVPCCAKCNWMKSDLTVEEFLQHIAKITSYIKIPNSK